MDKKVELAYYPSARGIAYVLEWWINARAIFTIFFTF
jgi:hypothetical protein